MKCLIAVFVMPSSTLMQTLQLLPGISQNLEIVVAHVNVSIPFWHLKGLDQFHQNLAKIPKDQSDFNQCIIGKT